MNYEVIYKKRKTVTISVKNATVTVKAPIGFPIEKIEALVKKHERWISSRLQKDKQIIEKEALITPDLEKRLRTEARAYFKKKMDEFADLMGAKYQRLTITGAKTRFGSCSSKGNISFSFRLMLYPEPAREYVVVHELAHLFEMNHSKQFYQIVEKYIPDYKERKKLLI